LKSVIPDDVESQSIFMLIQTTALSAFLKEAEAAPIRQRIAVFVTPLLAGY
jgi:hypothetical protein